MVLILKDIKNPSKLVMKAFSSSDSFTNKSGQATNKIKINDGDVIGQTMPWNGGEVGTFHFAFIKYEFAQQWRKELRAAYSVKGGVPDTYTPAAEGRYEVTGGVRHLKGFPHTRVSPLSWWVNPCGTSSPVRC